jgi:hypothetical protein
MENIYKNQSRSKPFKAISQTSAQTFSTASLPPGRYHRESHKIIPKSVKVAVVKSISFSFPAV